VGGNLPVDSAVFLGTSTTPSGTPGSLVVGISRIYTRDTSVPADGPVHLVVSGPTTWQSGGPFYFYFPTVHFLSQ
jgi:hypothetical protein